jgi:glucose/galactose transporter
VISLNGLPGALIKYVPDEQESLLLKNKINRQKKILLLLYQERRMNDNQNYCNMTSFSTADKQKTKIRKIGPIAIIGALFFIFGFITWLNAVLIPYLKISCELNNFQSYLVAFAFYIAYFFMAVPSAGVLRLTGFKNGMAAGLIVMALGALIFIPAALTRLYWVFLTGLFIQGAGLALLQTASNPYITILGPLESAAKRISIMGICNKFAGAIAPLILGSVALRNADQIKIELLTMNLPDKIQKLDELAARVITPYILIVIALVLLGILVYYSGLPEIDTDKEDNQLAQENGSKTSVFQFPHLLLGVLTLFFYVGAEVLAADSIIIYGTSLDIPLSISKFFATCTMAGMIIGYTVGIITIPRYMTQQNALKFSAVAGIVFSLLVLLTKGYVSVFSLAMLGLANALVWPAVWPLALANLGRFTKIASSLLIMGIAGGALIPLLYGRLADIFSPHQAYWILLPLYLFILYYAMAGFKVGRNREF